MENKKGQLHPITLMTNDIVRIFSKLGFEVATGPEMETEWYCFDALNVSKDHPARDMQDTFWIKQTPEQLAAFAEKEKSDRPVLRTHATSVTARELERAAKENTFPKAVVTVGKVFRNEATDVTHEMQFFHVDGFVVGENINLANLKATLLALYQGLLGEDIEIQLRPSYFPFVEPGLEVWIKFRNRWLEVMGAGMIHPNVLKNAGIDSEKYQGFAFGGGVDRILMVKYDIPDVRFLYQGDLRINQW
jgi:phenylalanyl-tRNA synthetase alpha chain